MKKDRLQLFHWWILIPSISVALLGIPGILRYFTGLSIFVGIWPMLCICVGLLVVLLHKTFQCSSTEYKTAIAFLALFLVGWFPVLDTVFTALYNKIFYGLVSVGGGDAGSHVFFKDGFIASNPKEYNGFIVLYTIQGFLEKYLRLDSVQSLRSMFYYVVIFITMIPAFYWTTYNAHGKHYVEKLWSVCVLFALPISIAVYFYILAPLLHYHQADGFYAHIFSMPIIILIWILYGALRSSLARISIFATLIIICRFTYGLNLPDLFFCFLCALVLEALDKNNTNLLRILYALGILPVIGLIILSLQALLPIFALNGGFTSIKVWMLVPILLLSAGFILFLSKNAFLSSSVNDKFAWIRYALMPVVMSICACIVCCALIFVCGVKLQYYVYKYFLTSQILSCLAILSFLPFFLLNFFHSGFSKKRFLSICIVLISIFLGNFLSISRYFSSFLERMHNAQESAAWKRISPLYDKVLHMKMKSVLSEHSAKFGGYIHPNWPELNFMNAVLGNRSGTEIYFHGKINLQKDHCVFWLNDSTNFMWRQNFPEQNKSELVSVVNQFSQNPSKECAGYNAPWIVQSTQILCWICSV